MHDTGSSTGRRLLVPSLTQKVVRRTHCSNKVHRLRQKLKLTHGKGKEFKQSAPVPVESLTNEQLVAIVFLLGFLT